MSEKQSTPAKKGAALGWFVLAGSALGVLGLGLLASSVNERRTEAALGKLENRIPIAKWESDNSKWGVNYPRQYDSWLATSKMVGKTKYAGAEPGDHLAHNPNFVILFAGMPFAKGYNAPRGHAYSVEDVKNTPRRSESTPATCWTCKSPDAPRLMARDGVAEYYAAPFDKYLDEAKNPIGCADCHNEETMALQISRPALKEALERQGKDIAKATHQEMRSLVCAQCHVEYYFKGKKEKYLTFPWDHGTKAEDMEKYYANSDHVDWTHAISGAKMIKMQHPDYEIYMEGIHAARGVSCADCHMPYKTEGGVKFTDHQIQSPLLNVANSCQVCHKWSETEIRQRVFSIQDKHKEMMTRAEVSLIALHLEIRDAANNGATDNQLADARKQVSRSQMYWDYVSANNGMGFHAPQETARILTKSLDIAQQTRLAVAKIRFSVGATQSVQIPDISTKEKAQAFIKPFVDEMNAKQKAAEANNARAATSPQQNETRPGSQRGERR